MLFGRNILLLILLGSMSIMGCTRNGMTQKSDTVSKGVQIPDYVQNSFEALGLSTINYTPNSDSTLMLATVFGGNLEPQRIDYAVLQIRDGKTRCKGTLKAKSITWDSVDKLKVVLVSGMIDNTTTAPSKDTYLFDVNSCKRQGEAK